MRKQLRDIYARLYSDEDTPYRIKGKRLEHTRAFLRDYHQPGPLLDVGCGSGDVLRMAEGFGFAPVFGVDAVEEARDLVGRDRFAFVPSVSCLAGISESGWDLVTCLDVLEHIEPDETEAALRELWRVARKEVVISVENKPSVYWGVDLHTNKRPFDEWFELVQDAWGDKAVQFNEKWFRCRKT